MSILSVDTIQPIGSGSTVTLNAAKIVVGTGITFESNGQAIYAGIITATSFSGSGANLTSLPAQATIANNADNRIITGGSGVNLNGESALTFDGNTLTVSAPSNDTPLIVDTASANGAHLRFQKDGSNQHFVGAGGGFTLGDREDLSLRAYDNLLFSTGNSSTERFRIDSSGNITNGGAFTTNNFFSGGIHLKKQSDVGIKFQRTQSGDSQTWDWGVSSAGHLTAAHVGDSGGTSSTKAVFNKNGDLEVIDGNLKINTAGHGIDFSAQTPTSATGASTTAEILDHYEEGSWTPVYLNVNTPTYGHRSGTYTRIGRAVHCQFQISVDSGLDTSDGSAVNIGGLPFAGNSAHESVVFSFGKLTNILSNARLAEVTNFRFGGTYIMLHRGSNYDINYTLCNSSGHLQAAFTYQMT